MHAQKYAYTCIYVKYTFKNDTHLYTFKCESVRPTVAIKLFPGGQIFKL